MNHRSCNWQRVDAETKKVTAEQLFWAELRHRLTKFPANAAKLKFPVAFDTFPGFVRLSYGPTFDTSWQVIHLLRRLQGPTTTSLNVLEEASIVAAGKALFSDIKKSAKVLERSKIRGKQSWMCYKVNVEALRSPNTYMQCAKVTSIQLVTQEVVIASSVTHRVSAVRSVEAMQCNISLDQPLQVFSDGTYRHPDNATCEVDTVRNRAKLLSKHMTFDSTSPSAPSSSSSEWDAMYGKCDSQKRQRNYLNSCAQAWFYQGKCIRSVMPLLYHFQQLLLQKQKRLVLPFKEERNEIIAATGILVDGTQSFFNEVSKYNTNGTVEYEAMGKLIEDLPVGIDHVAIALLATDGRVFTVDPTYCQIDPAGVSQHIYTATNKWKIGVWHILTLTASSVAQIQAGTLKFDLAFNELIQVNAATLIQRTFRYVVRQRAPGRSDSSGVVEAAKSMADTKSLAAQKFYCSTKLRICLASWAAYKSLPSACIETAVTAATAVVTDHTSGIQLGDTSDRECQADYVHIMPRSLNQVCPVTIHRLGKPSASFVIDAAKASTSAHLLQLVRLQSEQSMQATDTLSHLVFMGGNLASYQKLPYDLLREEPHIFAVWFQHTLITTRRLSTAEQILPRTPRMPGVPAL